MVGQVLGEVVALLGCLRRLDRSQPFVQRRVPLVVLAADEPVEVLEATAAGGPAVERTHRARLPDRDLVALPELCRRVAVQLERLRQRRHRVRSLGGVSGCRCRDLGDAAHPDRVMVTTGQQGGTCRGAQRGRVEAGVLDGVGGDRVEIRRVAWTAERRGRAEPDVVDEDDQDVRGAIRRPQRLDRRKADVGILGVVQDRAGIGLVGDREDGASLGAGSRGQRCFLQVSWVRDVDPRRARSIPLAVVDVRLWLRAGGS